MATTITQLTFTKDWTDADDFPTVQTDEEQVRADMQVLHNETKTYINGTLVPVCQNLQDALDDLPSAGLGDMMRNTYDTSRRATDIFDYADAVKPKVGTIAVTTNWSGTGPFTQTVVVSSVTITSKSKVDLQPSSTVLAQLMEDDITAMYVSNTSGTLTLYAVGDTAPTQAMSIQATVTETY